MELLAIGLLLLMTWSLGRFSLAVGAMLAPVANRFSPRSGDGTVPLVLRSLIQVIASPAPFAQKLKAALAQGLRLRAWRTNLMQACFADVGAWAPLLVATLLFKVSGVFVLAAAGLVLVVAGPLGARVAGSGDRFFARLAPFARSLAAVLFFAGLFLLLGETIGRFLGAWAQGTTGEFAMLLADNRPGTVFLVTLVMTAISALAGFEGLAVALAVVGLTTGALSLNGAVALLWGERLGLSLRLWFQARGQVGSVRRMAKLGAIGNAIAVPIALVFLGILRDLAGLDGGRGNAPMALESFAIFGVLTTIPFLAVAGAIGHFAAKKTPEDLMDRRPVPESWLASPVLAAGDLDDLRAGTRARVRELERLNGGFTDEEWKKVPPPVRQASESELRHVQSEAGRLDAHLLSRWDFFGHQLR